jgi:plasmid stability protein
MKATIDIDDDLYRRLKIEAARQGRTVRDMVADGVRYVLEGDVTRPADAERATNEEWRPAWFGLLRPWGKEAATHDMRAVRESIVQGRARRSAP